MIFSQALGDAQAGGNPIRIRDIDQPRNAAQERVFLRIEHAVGIGHFPQHLDQSDALLRIHALDRKAGEGIELVRAFACFNRLAQQFARLFRRKLEFLGQQAFDDAAFGVFETIIHAGGFDEQHRDRNLQSVPVRRRRWLCEEFDDGVEHDAMGTREPVARRH